MNKNTKSIKVRGHLGIYTVRNDPSVILQRTCHWDMFEVRSSRSSNLSDVFDQLRDVSDAPDEIRSKIHLYQVVSCYIVEDIEKLEYEGRVVRIRKDAILKFVTYREEEMEKEEQWKKQEQKEEQE